ncbi:Hypothetical predicted protein [Olea europaea subsp. europaea]|uniref:Uncharacterized protein n=1 Tax=Olea europaea subsp. europaea TaxID=158383 RepID=A0A8S0SV20_OLEEU|nr:Hypothetical predicted protein [Olea europaea subsp. europaea]
MANQFLLSQLDELELKEFLASDESEADDNDDDNDTKDRSVKIYRKQDMYRVLLQSGDGGSDDNDEDNAQDMEVTFNTGLEDISKHILEKDKKSETVRGTKRDKPNQETVQEAEASRAELELLLTDDTGMDNYLKGYNLKPKKRKGKKGKEIPDEEKIPDVDYDDL